MESRIWPRKLTHTIRRHLLEQPFFIRLNQFFLWMTVTWKYKMSTQWSISSAHVNQHMSTSGPNYTNCIFANLLLRLVAQCIFSCISFVFSFYFAFLFHKPNTSMIQSALCFKDQILAMCKATVRRLYSGDPGEWEPRCIPSQIRSFNTTCGISLSCSFRVWSYKPSAQALS